MTVLTCPGRGGSFAYRGLDDADELSSSSSSSSSSLSSLSSGADMAESELEMKASGTCSLEGGV